ncbi:MAG: HAD family hydrolase [Desulfocapsaceae bacterium]|nr:HAD family hydrolase [Desulfocapsaceae bacterium]
MLKLIVFDCDGVMFDSRRANQEYYNYLLNHYNHPPMDEQELEYVHMHSAPDSVRHIFRNYDEHSFEEIDGFRRDLGYDRFLPCMKIETDLIDFLDKVKPLYHLAISTNRGNTMAPLLKLFELEKYFAKVVTSETASRPKPAPDGLLEIMAYFNCTAEETIFIGDSSLDQLHAAACQVPLIAFKSPALVADYHVGSFMEILALPPFVKNCS